MQKKIKGGITAPQGFMAAGLHCGIKAKKMDIALIRSTLLANIAGTFTQHAFAAAPVRWSRQIVGLGKAKAIVVNSGNANACTGPDGEKDARKMASMVAHDLSILQHHVLVASTGVIGKPMPMGRIHQGIHKLSQKLSRKGAKDAARAILTTDTGVKETAYETLIQTETIRMGAIAKGAGMVAPNMATMLCFITTDAKIYFKLLKEALNDVIERTFNRITVDGDMSTNDMVLVLANGCAQSESIRKGSLAYRTFKNMLFQTCLDLAKAIVRDGEGATKLIGVRIHGAKNKKEAKNAAFSIADYILFKISVYAENPNWGRLLAGLGSSGIRGLDLKKIDVFLNEKLWVHKGVGGLILIKPFKKISKSKEIILDVHLARGQCDEIVWTCDMTHRYIDENM